MQFPDVLFISLNGSNVDSNRAKLFRVDLEKRSQSCLANMSQFSLNSSAREFRTFSKNRIFLILLVN